MYSNNHRSTGRKSRRNPENKRDYNKGTTLKGKLEQLQEMATELATEMKKQDDDALNQVSMKNTLENVLYEQAENVKKTLNNEILRIKEDFDRHLEYQAGENKRYL